MFQLYTKKNIKFITPMPSCWTAEPMFCFVCANMFFGFVFSSEQRAASCEQRAASREHSKQRKNGFEQRAASGERRAANSEQRAQNYCFYPVKQWFFRTRQTWKAVKLVSVKRKCLTSQRFWTSTGERNMQNHAFGVGATATLHLHM